MDLNALLEKTKSKAAANVIVRTRPIIATEDRPYDIKIKNKPKTNQRQTKDKVESQPETNWGQTGDKLETVISTKFKDKIETRDTTRDTTRDQPETNWRQTGDKNSNVINFARLVGLQREIAFLLFQECKKSRSKVTSPLSVEHLSKSCHSKVSSIKKTLQRLENKAIIHRVEWKDGRGGWTRYELAEYIYNEILHDEPKQKLETNWRQTGDKVESQPETQLETTLSSSSGNYNNITTTTSLGDMELNSLRDYFDIACLNDIGFRYSHVEQILKSNENHKEDIQESIYAFAFDLEFNKSNLKIKGEPLNFFMGIMRRGLYNPSPNYLNPKDRALKMILEKRQESLKIQQELEDDLLKAHFERWEKELSLEEREKYASEEAKKSGLRSFIKASLMTYHRDVIWPVSKANFYKTQGVPYFEIDNSQN